MSTIQLKSAWVKLTINNKFIFYNYKEDIVTYHPPFPLSQIDQFLKYYHYEIDRQELLRQLGAKANQRKCTSNQDNISKKKKQIDLNLNPITSETILQDCVRICTNESIEKVVTFVFNHKYDINPSYQYIESEKQFKCQLKIKERELLTGEQKETKALAKKDVEMTMLKKLIPTIFNEVFMIDNKKKEERRLKYLMEYRQKFKSKEPDPLLDLMPQNDSHHSIPDINTIINHTPKQNLLSSTFTKSKDELISESLPKEDKHDDIEMIDLISDHSETSPDIDDPSILDLYSDKTNYLPFKVYIII